MNGGTIPRDLPPLYRGGASVVFKSHEVKIDRMTGLLKTSHGISLDADPNHVARFGGAYVVRRIPAGLKVIQRGQRSTHYEIVPETPMTPQTYQRLLHQIVLVPMDEES